MIALRFELPSYRIADELIRLQLEAELSIPPKSFSSHKLPLFHFKSYDETVTLDVSHFKHSSIIYSFDNL